MKKKGLIIASVLILVLSFVFLGCPPPEDETNDPTVPADVLTKLSTFGFTGTLPVPEGGNYEKYKEATVTTEQDEETYTAPAFYIVWNKCTEDIMTAYKGLWTGKVQSIKATRDISADNSFGLKDIGTNIKSGRVYFTAEGGTLGDLTVGENSIVFFVRKDWAAAE